MKKEIVEVLELLAAYYRTQLTPMQFSMYAEDLSCLSRDELVKACQEYRKNPENKFFPLPSALIGIVRPVETDLDLGQDVSSKVIKAVSKFGSYRAEEAKKFIGEIGWECVQRMGGWKTFCSELTEDTKGIFNAQIRGLAQTIAKKAKNGTLDQPQNFPTPIGGDVVQKLIGDFTNKGGV
ncbi:MAG: hypothetical protein EBZ69_01685 [Alphaproteobacteria bacterium]|nr:hypothetical protein [Alphaproteobacteria bacterium]